MHLILKFILIAVVVSFFASCKPEVKIETMIHDPTAEAREDSIEYANALKSQATINHSVKADIETAPVKAMNSEDAADDPAIWYNNEEPSESIIYGTNKRGGLVAYDINGSEIMYYELGRINNVDVLQFSNINNQDIDVLACTNRSDQSIEIYMLEEGKLSSKLNKKIMMDTSIMDDIYGICFAKSMDENEVFVFANAKNGRVQQYRIDVVIGQSIEATLNREIQFDSQTEGMVADHSKGNLYIGVEDGGIWKMKIDPKSGDERTLLEQSKPENNAYIRYDLEGLTILKSGEYDLLLASSQGNFTYAVFDIKDNDRYLGSFKVMDGDNIDGVEETDGIDIVADSLTEQFDKGMLVLQDGFNYNGDTIAPQNFKYVDLKKVLNLPFVIN